MAAQQWMVCDWDWATWVGFPVIESVEPFSNERSVIPSVLMKETGNHFPGPNRIVPLLGIRSDVRWSKYRKAGYLFREMLLPIKFHNARRNSSALFVLSKHIELVVCLASSLCGDPSLRSLCERNGSSLELLEVGDAFRQLSSRLNATHSIAHMVRFVAVLYGRRGPSARLNCLVFFV